jgi:hypothetical protein
MTDTKQENPEKEDTLSMLLSLAEVILLGALLFGLLYLCIHYQNKTWHEHNDACKPICTNILNDNQRLDGYSKASLDFGINFICECSVYECETPDCNIYEPKTLYVNLTK